MASRFSLRGILAAAPLWALAGILLFASWSRAEDPPEQRHRKENRFLFVIDASSAMKARSDGIKEAVNGLLASGMKGQLRKGDTIGVWTYNDRLNAEFPMQIWSDKKKDDIVADVRDHLRDLQYEKRSHLEKVLPEINKLVAHSERLTVILVFDGVDLIKGTPFDKDINDLHKQYAREFKAAHSPFVTLLSARDGAVFDYTINYPGTVVVPPTADPLLPETNAPPAVAASAPPAVIPHPPEESKPPRRRIEITLSGSNFAHNAAVPPPAASNVVETVTPPPVPAPVVVTNEPAPVVVQAVNTNAAPPETALPPPPAAAAPPPAPEVAVKAPPSAPAVVAVIPPAPPASAGQQVAMFITAFSLLTIAVVLVLFLVRRSRSAAPPSLISQSIDRTR
jgi:von Willebrand factor type A domain